MFSRLNDGSIIMVMCSFKVHLATKLELVSFRVIIEHVWIISQAISSILLTKSYIKSSVIGMRMSSAEMIKQRNVFGDKVRSTMSREILTIDFSRSRCFAGKFQTILWFYTICCWIEWTRWWTSKTITANRYTLSTWSTVSVKNGDSVLEIGRLLSVFSKLVKSIKPRKKKLVLNKLNARALLLVCVRNGSNKMVIPIFPLVMMNLMQIIGKNAKNTGRVSNSSNYGRKQLVQYSFFSLSLSSALLPSHCFLPYSFFFLQGTTNIHHAQYFSNVQICSSRFFFFLRLGVVSISLSLSLYVCLFSAIWICSACF